MQSVSWQNEFCFQIISPSIFDETQVQLLVWAVDFIPYDRMADRGEMHPNLMGASGARNRSNDGEPVAG